ncbi:TetR family transcriptional regulator [Alcanivorax hongdengensis A-11-3]|uniref:TetR family transcriptional regulator n=1 Tax=Alcanivorax hongdengensis A-11-3 TaxID=1177179 RepID=L0W9R2_9GAMM|nr:TetR/AcrR family transcriptional regulator [Alcanivorax hongdengensis]EKF73739.1 TetR family transcriptional regulator [Alcanivorax hongdengensis A-11-3]
MKTAPDSHNSAPRGRPKDLAKRAAILEAAKSLFLVHGFAGTGMDAVAADAGVSKLTVYNHFRDKETLFTAAVSAKCENMMALPSITLDSSESLKSVLQQIGEAFLAMINSDEAVNLHRLMANQAHLDTEMARLFFEAGPQRTLDEMERLLVDARQRGLLRMDDTAIAAEQFFSLLQGCRHMKVLIGCDAPHNADETTEHVGHTVKMFLAAYGTA